MCLCVQVCLCACVPVRAGMRVSPVPVRAGMRVCPCACVCRYACVPHVHVHAGMRVYPVGLCVRSRACVYVPCECVYVFSVSVYICV